MGALRESPGERGLPPFELFLCTYEGTLGVEKTRGAPARQLGRRTSEDGEGETVKRYLAVLEPTAEVPNLDSNFHHKWLEGQEAHSKVAAKRKKQKAAQARAGKKTAPALKRERTPQGDGSCFNSSITARIVIDPAAPPAGAELPAAVAETIRRHGAKGKEWAVRYFPSTGKAQVTGCVCPGYEDGPYIVRVWAAYLAGQQELCLSRGLPPLFGGAPGIAEERTNMLNYKTKVALPARGLLKLEAIWAHFLPHAQAAKLRANVGGGALEEARRARRLPADYKGDWGEEAWDALAAPPPSPNFVVWDISPQQSTNRLMLKLFRPDGKEKVATVKMFPGGKVNALGLKQKETILEIHAFLSAALQENWGELTAVPPLTDRERRKLLKDPPVEKVDGHHVEEDEEDPLEGGAEGRRAAAGDGAAEARQDAVGKNVADDEEE